MDYSSVFSFDLHSPIVVTIFDSSYLKQRMRGVGWLDNCHRNDVKRSNDKPPPPLSISSSNAAHISRDRITGA
ncbi:unnamed protein product [Onchocerca flexuosa]|uniref:Ovule protein n=1 Tax=Onchocerca flexuosa TaxID=387005 RepID=A0A183HKQ6_9BILA|nr:unnamed protein product [Onchocerca flexuosa]